MFSFSLKIFNHVFNHCRTTLVLANVSFPFAMTLPSIHCHIGGTILCNSTVSLTLFLIKYLFLNNLLIFWKSWFSTQMQHRILVSQYQFSGKRVPVYLYFCSCSILVYQICNLHIVIFFFLLITMQRNFLQRRITHFHCPPSLSSEEFPVVFLLCL